MSRPPRPVDPGPRTGIDRLMDWGNAQIWGERQPEWYEEPGVFESLPPDQQAELTAYMRGQTMRGQAPAPVGQMAGVTNIANAAEAVGRAGEAIGGMFQGKPKEPVYNTFAAMMEPVNRAIRARQEAEIKRLSAEQSIMEYLIQDMAPPERMAAPPPQTGGVQDRAPYSDPYAEQQFQQQRFQEMSRLRRLPIPPGG